MSEDSERGAGAGAAGAVGRWYVRDPAVVALSRGDTYVFLRSGAPAIELGGVDVAALSLLLDRTALPIERGALLEVCDEDTLGLLLEHGILRRHEPGGGAPAAGGEGRPCRRLVLGLTGAVGTLDAVPLVLAIARAVADELDVVLTRGARKMLGRHTFTYFGHRTWTDPFAPAHGAGVPHMHLAGADVVLVAPASAAAIARLATGACTDLLSLVVAATTAPVIVAPAMNEAMWRHPAIARNVAQLRADGLWIVEPRVGYEVGEPGHPPMMGGLGFNHLEVARVVRGVLELDRAGAGA